MEKRRRLFIALAAVIFVAGAARGPAIDIDIAPGAIDRAAPAQVQAAVDLGIAGVSILVTLGGERLGR